jgi:hypothetical protein
MSNNQKGVSLTKIITSASLVLGGGMILGGLFLRKKYKTYLEF